MEEPMRIGDVLPDVLANLQPPRAAGPLRVPGTPGSAIAPERDLAVYSPANPAQPEPQGPEAVGSELLNSSRPEAGPTVEPPQTHRTPSPAFEVWRNKLEQIVLLVAEAAGWMPTKRELAKTGSLYLVFKNPTRAVTVCVRIADHPWRGNEAFRQFSLYPAGKWRVVLGMFIDKMGRSGAPGVMNHYREVISRIENLDGSPRTTGPGRREGAPTGPAADGNPASDTTLSGGGGGHMTNSPPANVVTQTKKPICVLASGIDSLVLTMDVKWPDQDLFKSFDELQLFAKHGRTEEPGQVQPADGSEPWVFNVQPFGTRGYSWILTSADLTLKVGGWLTPTTRPGIVAEIRSEPLWTHSPGKMIRRIVSIINGWGAQVESINLSRADICTDVLIPAKAWDKNLDEHFITRADLVHRFSVSEATTGWSIGSGDFMARIYDKATEIKRKSHKFWMFDIWGIPQEGPDESQRAIRVEYQLRREALKALKVPLFEDLESNLPNVWAYCTQDWLRLVKDRGKHHTHQKVLPWWSVVQSGVNSAQTAAPAVRKKAETISRAQAQHMVLAGLTTLAAFDHAGRMIEPSETLDMKSHAAMYLDQLPSSDEDFTRRVKVKVAKVSRVHPDSSKPAGNDGN